VFVPGKPFILVLNIKELLHHLCLVWFKLRPDSITDLTFQQKCQECFLVKRVSGRGPEQRVSEKTVLYLQVIIILISYIIITLLNYKLMKTIPAETGNRTLVKSVDRCRANKNVLQNFSSKLSSPILY
jgi:hypothetical protein